jgi:hypothetical protein
MTSHEQAQADKALLILRGALEQLQREMQSPLGRLHAAAMRFWHDDGQKFVDGSPDLVDDIEKRLATTLGSVAELQRLLENLRATRDPHYVPLSVGIAPSLSH